MDRHLILIIGNIASGKSTFAKRLDRNGYLCVSSDSLRYMFHPDEYIFDVDENYAIHKTAHESVSRIMEIGRDVCVDDAGLVMPFLREKLIKIAKLNAYKVIAVIMPKINRKKSVERRMKSPHGSYSAKVWGDVYDKFDTCYVKPTKKEGFDAVLSPDSPSVRRLLPVA